MSSPLQGPDVGELLEVLGKDNGDLQGEAYVPLDTRIARLEAALATLPAHEA